MNYEGAMNETRKMCFLMKQVSHDGEVSLPFIRPPPVRVPLSRLIILLSDKKQIVRKPNRRDHGTTINYGVIDYSRWDVRPRCAKAAS